MEYSIADVAKAAGVSTRTLRHYDAIGLLVAGRRTNGYRAYDEQGLLRLQRILVMRELGMSLSQIAEVLAGDADDVGALRSHLQHLRDQATRLDRQIASVERTLRSIDNQEALMAQDMFDGFDHTQHKQEVEQRWGRQAWTDGDRWWRGLSADDKQAFGQEHLDIAAAWASAREAGLAVDDPQVQQIAARHAAWIAVGWQGREPSPEALIGLGQMYVADERFAANYGGVEGAQYVCDGLAAYARTLG